MLDLLSNLGSENQTTIKSLGGVLNRRGIESVLSSNKVHHCLIRHFNTVCNSLVIVKDINDFDFGSVKMPGYWY